jgi:hypothetical protein
MGEAKRREQFYGYNAEAPVPTVPGVFQFFYPGKGVSSPHDIKGTVVEKYLNLRGIHLSDLDIDWSPLRFHISVRHKQLSETGGRLSFPAMGATVIGWQHDVVPVPIGASFTFLEDDGRKLDRPGLLARLFAKGGHHIGGGVWFGTAQPDETFVVGEGIETTLSAMILFEARAGVATLAANYLPAVVLPDAAQTILIAADHDGPESNNIGFRKAAYAAALWRKEGRIVALKRPSAPKTDFNDILRKRRGIPL